LGVGELPSKHQTEDPEISPQSCRHLILNKAAKKTYWRKDILFNKWFWENWISAPKRLKLDS
jgi:hypothetical protein